MTLEESIDEEMGFVNVVERTSYTDIFSFDIINGNTRKFTESEIIFIVMFVISIIGIPLIIPLICNIKILDHFYQVIEYRASCLPLFFFLYILSIVYHIICIPLYPFILMCKKL